MYTHTCRWCISGDSEGTIVGAVAVMLEIGICIHILVSGTYTHTWREQAALVVMSDVHTCTPIHIYIYIVVHIYRVVHVVNICREMPNTDRMLGETWACICVYCCVRACVFSCGHIFRFMYI